MEKLLSDLVVFFPIIRKCSCISRWTIEKTVWDTEEVYFYWLVLEFHLMRKLFGLPDMPEI